MADKKIYRCSGNKVIAGVCSDIGNYLNVDVYNKNNICVIIGFVPAIV